MLKLFSFAFIFCTQMLFANSQNEIARKKRILSIINEELSEVIRLNKQQRGSRPETIFRLVELFAEKARISKENENDSYLSIPAQKRIKISKKNYFKDSKNLFKKSIRYGLTIPKKFPRYKSLGDVYFIIAQNYKEIDQDEKAKKYYELAAQKSKNKVIIDYSHLILANYYFNEKQFSRSIPYFEKSLKNKNDKWWTKDTFNLSWAYYKTKNYEKSISKLKEVYDASSSKFVDMRQQVENDIAFVYIAANKISEGIQFYKKNKIDFLPIFLNVSSKLISDGKFSQAESLLDKLFVMENNEKLRLKIQFEKLYLFSKYSDEKKHLNLSKIIVKKIKDFSPEDRSQLYFQVSKKAALIQKAISSGLYKNIPRKNILKAKRAAQYFYIASLINPNKRDENLFYRAETYFTGSLYDYSLKAYLKSFDVARDNKSEKLQLQSAEGMIASLGKKSLSLQVKEKFYAPVYERYLLVDSKSNRAKMITKKLFKVYFDKKQTEKLEKILLSFSLNFKKDIKAQEAMLAQILEIHRLRKNSLKLKELLTLVSEGKILISSKFQKTIDELKTKLEIESVQSLLISGNKDKALAGYKKIYQSPEVNRKGKANAAYNLSAIYFELSDLEECFRWVMISIKEMTAKEVVQFSDSLLSMAAGFFQQQEILKSVQLSQTVFDKICYKNSRNKIISFKNSVFMALANGDFETVQDIRKTASKCGIPEKIISSINIEVMKDLIAQKKWEDLSQIIEDLEKNSKNYPQLIAPLEALRLAYENISQNDLALSTLKKQNDFFETSRKMNLFIPVEALNIIGKRTLNRAQFLLKELKDSVLSFPEQKFNDSVKMNLKRLEELTSIVAKIQNLGSGQVLVDGYKILVEAYDYFAQKLQHFTPPHKNDEYKTSFKKAMETVYRPLFDNAKKYKNEIQKIILDNKILSHSNISFFSTGPIVKMFDPIQPIVMDRRGLR